MDKTRKELYVKIIARAKDLGLQTTSEDDLGLLMDIESADKKFDLRLDEWLEAEVFDFTHEFVGIQTHINRGEFPATDFGFFIPRFAG